MGLSYLPKILIKTAKCNVLSAVLAFGILLTVSLFVNWIVLYFVAGILFLVPLLERFVWPWMPKERISPDGKAVFISGCDSGFGYLLAQRLDDIGFQVFAGCLFPEGDGAADLRKSGSQRLHVIGLDVRSGTSVEEAANYVGKNLNGNALWGVVNNAGVGLLGEVDWLSMELIESLTDINLLGVIRVTKAFLPKLKESKGKIITVASLAGCTSVPGLVPYCMSKAAVINFCDGLRQELYKWGIQVITIVPSFYRTSIINREALTKRAKTNWENTSKEVKGMYDSNYIDTFIKKMLFFFRSRAKDPNEVISAMEDALTDSYAQYCYAPGSYLLHFASWLSKRSQKPILDIVTLYVIFGKELT